MMVRFFNNQAWATTLSKADPNMCLFDANEEWRLHNGGVDVLKERFPLTWMVFAWNLESLERAQRP